MYRHDDEPQNTLEIGWSNSVNPIHWSDQSKARTRIVSGNGMGITIYWKPVF